MNAFELTAHDLGALTLRPLLAKTAEKLGEALAAMPPWSVIGCPADRMGRLGLRREQPTMKKFEVLAGRRACGC